MGSSARACWRKGSCAGKKGRKWKQDVSLRGVGGLIFFSPPKKMWTFAVFCPTVPIPWFNWVLSCHKVFSMERISVPEFFILKQDQSLFIIVIPSSRACTWVSISSVECVWLYRRQTVEQVLEPTCLPDQGPNLWAKELLFDFSWPWKYLIWCGQMELDQGGLDPLVTIVWKI